MSKRLLLVAPSYKKEVLLNAKPLIFPPLNLGILAALTPKNYEIMIIDENKQDINEIQNQNFDLVGITALTNTAPRAYEIANQFRRRGITTVMGGIHASALPDEALRFVDSVVVGEVENVWPKVIEDFENKRLKTRYNEGFANLEGLVKPKRELYTKNLYRIPTIQTARGCPMNCDFCSVTLFNGRTYRQRPINEVLDELETLDSKITFFVDDNIIGYGKNAEERAVKLFKGIVDRGINIKWGSQASINIANNKEVLYWASRSGAKGFFIGMESINPESLKEMNKQLNIKRGVKNYTEVINRLHDYGIMVFGSFMFGNDNDTKDVFSTTTDFVLDSGLDVVQYAITTPMPQTKLYKRLMSEGRIFRTNYPSDWKYYDIFHSVYHPKNFSAEELEERAVNCYKKTNSLSSSLIRAVKTFSVTRDFKIPLYSFLINFGIRKFGKYDGGEKSRDYETNIRQ